MPLADGLSSIVWSTSTTHAKELLTMSEGNFVDAINEALVRDGIIPIDDEFN